MAEFNTNWYKKFIESSNEKKLLVKKISDLLDGKLKNSCLEIGLGISPYFAKKLAKSFNRYVIIERKIFNGEIPTGIKFIEADWENVEMDEKFDVIIASHVTCYFRDKKKAVEKMLNSLNPDGRIFLIVNGAASDCGRLKLAFARMLNSDYKFTYDELKELLRGKNFKEYTLPSVIKFKTYDELFEILKLYFDRYPKEYKKLKPQIIEYFRKNIKGNKFIIDQKVLEVTL